jgi:hypothetical protein
VVHIEEEQTGGQLPSCNSQQDTAGRCDADPARQKYRGLSLIVVMKNQVAERSLDLD